MHEVSNNFLPANVSNLGFIQHKCIAITLGFQRQVVSTLNILGQISLNTHFLVLVQEFGTVFLKVSE